MTSVRTPLACFIEIDLFLLSTPEACVPMSEACVPA